MSNPQVEQAALDAQLQMKAAEAEYQSLRVKLESDLMTQKAGAATVNADYGASATAGGNRQGAVRPRRHLGPGVQGFQGQSRRTDHAKRSGRCSGSTINQKAIESQLAEQQAKVDQMRALAELKQKQLDALKVRAGIDGVSGRFAVAGRSACSAGNHAGESGAAQSPDGGVEDSQRRRRVTCRSASRHRSIRTTESLRGDGDAASIPPCRTEPSRST